MYGGVAFAAGREGILMAHGADLLDLARRASSYVDRILRSAKPSELPVQYPTKFELAVNLKTAKAIGVTIPETFLARADQVIE